MTESSIDKGHVYHEKFSKTIQYLSLLSLCFISIGDGVEMYLPSVITQPSSCELHLSATQERVLGLVLYVSAGFTIFFVIPLSNRLGRRPELLASLYLSIAVTVFCAVVPNYASLLISRIFLGIVLAINLSTCNVYISEIAGSKSFYVTAVMLGTICYSLGAGWCGILGYLFLGKIGWRYFIIITSVPFFIIPLVLLQVILPESSSMNVNLETSPLTTQDSTTSACGTTLTRRSIYLRLSKLVAYMLTNFTPWNGCIMLVPSVVRVKNLENNQTFMCSSMIGSQFLLITIIFGICRCGGTFLCYLVQGRLKSATILSLSSMISIAIYVAITLCSHNAKVIFALIALVQLVAATPINEIEIMASDRTFFEQENLALSSGLQMAAYCLTLALENIISEVLDYNIVLKMFLVFAVLGLPTGLFFFIK